MEDQTQIREIRGHPLNPEEESGGRRQRDRSKKRSFLASQGKVTSVVHKPKSENPRGPLRLSRASKTFEGLNWPSTDNYVRYRNAIVK